MFKTLMLLTLLALGQSVSAFDRDQIDGLTKAASYTFDRICELHNPDPFFDEGDLAALVDPFTNDLYSFLNSYDNTQAAQYGRGKRPVRAQSILTINDNDEEPDCAALQVVESQLKTFSEVFQNMTYAIGEICYRQCQSGGKGWYATDRLQAAMEQMYTGSLAAQVRKLEARTRCYFISDLFLVENERAVDYTLVWINTFQRMRTPCAGMKAARHEDKARKSPLGRSSRIF